MPSLSIGWLCHLYCYLVRTRLILRPFISPTNHLTWVQATNMLRSFQPLVLLALIHFSYEQPDMGTRLHIYQLSAPSESHMLVYYQVLTHGGLHAAIINSDIMKSLTWYNDRYNTGESGKSKLVSHPTHNPHVPPGEKRSGEQSWISGGYCQKVVRTTEIARSVIIT